MSRPLIDQYLALLDEQGFTAPKEVRRRAVR
jgi:hypothetical protein